MSSLIHSQKGLKSIRGLGIQISHSYSALKSQHPWLVSRKKETGETGRREKSERTEEGKGRGTELLGEWKRGQLRTFKLHDIDIRCLL